MTSIFTDATPGPDKADPPKGGYGFWIKGDDHPQAALCGYGPIIEPRTTSCCEAYAMLMATRAYRDHHHVNEAGVLMQSDCLAALHWWLLADPEATISQHPDGAPLERPNPRKKRKPSKGREYIEEAVSIMAALGVQVRLRHVRGHKNGGGRQYVNRLCDRLAREGAKVNAPGPLGSWFIAPDGALEMGTAWKYGRAA